MTLTLPTTLNGQLDVSDLGWKTVAKDLELPSTNSLARDPFELLKIWTIPSQETRKVALVQTQLHRIIEWTGWSRRKVAQALGTTHPTVSAILDGRQISNRLQPISTQIAMLYNLVSRLRIVVNSDQNELRRALDTKQLKGSLSSIDLIKRGELAEAYLAALDALSPPRVSGLMQSRFPRRAGEASVPLYDE
ncbi:MAG: hypothetical protein HKL80_11880 [Acidimicrobiales bacterium]|nr:hypothetical protein [Acidimicrobiales bacterium]